MNRNRLVLILLLVFAALILVVELGGPMTSAQARETETLTPTHLQSTILDTRRSTTAADLSSDPDPEAMSAPCTDSVSVGGYDLDDCQGTTFTLGGNTWTLSVYYTLDTSAGDHWINSDAEASNVLPWMQLAAEAYYDQSGKTYGASTCGRHIRAKIQKGNGWSGIAWWPNSCYIGLDAPMIRGGSGRHTTMHEMRHKFFQFAYTDCVDDWKSGYDGNADIVEGDADYGPSTVGDYGYFNNAYDPNKSMYKHGYGNRFIPYYSEHVAWYASPLTSPGDPDYLSEGMVEHMERCETYDDIYVERETVEALTPYSYEEFFLNFFAANWAFDWADSTTQPDLYYFEKDAPGVTVNSMTMDYDVNLSTSQAYNGHNTPDKWAGRYYQFTPQAGCDFVMLEGDGEHHAKLGWAFMAADTAAPSAEYSGWVGEDFSRVFAGHGANNRVAAAVVGFGSNYDYDLNASCVNPQIEILIPLNPNHVAYVGDPSSPVAFLGHIRVTSGGNPVAGIPPDWFVLDADGDAVAVESLYEVTKGHYLGVFVPPAKPAGTNWVDLRACLNTTGICDNNTDALLYVPPANVDMVLLHDASGSMGDVDVPGDYSRLQQAKIAARLLLLLARTGDYYGIMDFSARNTPPGCNPNCPPDNKVIYPKTEITNPATQIPLFQAAIDTMSDREWTDLGQGLVDAQLMVLGAPYSANNKVVAVLSDGEQNINPMYDDISASISVVVNTWGFSGDAPNDLLARIAAEKGGVFNYVPTSPGSSMTTTQAQQDVLQAQIMAALQDQPLAPESVQEMAQMLASAYLPGGLALADSYDYLHTDESGGARIMQAAHTGIAELSWREQTAYVSKADNTLLMVSSSVEPEYGSCEGWKRDVEVLMPGKGEREWIPISPPKSVPSNWDVRNSSFPSYSDALYVRDPEPGVWRMRTRLYQSLCTTSGESVPAAVTATADFIMEGSVWSTINLDGRILLANGQGRIGEPVPLVASLLQRKGTLPGATVLALVEKPGSGFDLFLLRDDGLSNDGAAGDGIYGNTYFKSTLGGPYDVTLLAGFEDPSAPGQTLYRFWKGSYYMDDDYRDTDDDRFPPWWEDLYDCMDNKRYDNPQADYDNDGAINWVEWEHGTNPCDPDTDDGGEMDGSEIKNGRNPHWPNDDKVRPFYNWQVRPLNQAIVVQWSRPQEYTKVYIRVEDEDGRGNVYEGGKDGELRIALKNNVNYFVSLQGESMNGEGAPTEPINVMPKSDPDAPSGFLLIENGASETYSKDVSLYINASDIPLDGMPAPSGTATIANKWTINNEVSGEIEMRFSNDLAGTWSRWEAYRSRKQWKLDCQLGTPCIVYGQFRDAAGNESLIISDDILYSGARLYMPVVRGK